MTEKWTVYYLLSGERATENSWPTKEWAEYMARANNERRGYGPSAMQYADRV